MGHFFQYFLFFRDFLRNFFCPETTLRDLSKNDKIGTFWTTWSWSIFCGLFKHFEGKVSILGHTTHFPLFFLVSSPGSKMSRNTATKKSASESHYSESYTLGTFWPNVTFWRFFGVFWSFLAIFLIKMVKNRENIFLNFYFQW